MRQAYQTQNSKASAPQDVTQQALSLVIRANVYGPFVA